MTENPPAVDEAAQSLRDRINTSQPHTARIWNYWLGGKDNYEVDRAAGDQIRQLHPGIGEYARADRLFLGRAVRHLVHDVGIRQFLDIGTGLPTADNTHEVAQAAAPEARIVYVDNDPLVLAHARALLTSSPEGRTDYLDEDLRNVDAILEHAAKTLDFSKPVALILLGVVIFVGDDEDPYSLVRRLVDRLPAGSHLVLSHTITSPSMPDVDEAVKFWNEHGTPKLTQRTPEDVARFFDGLELLEPGVLSCSRWRPEGADASEPEEVAMFGGVARKL
ncbi:SAM-dependent methyltransferase [Streptomyces sp. ID05-39B]|uniref:SAM-dependent methyltransferase n=1 Tax=Streptomyces sp. ID05-39B TaxID=3028664 RepID=UPI0029B10A63|nr:SAM-dependent methyltransferase [Streptomyces sp. ID05-39B]MDX3527093.1 SAM-dependent methyltransferase [Streptomyces sp. ID05-39B]